jgi:DNA-binding transcriptional LysR family regulator
MLIDLIQLRTFVVVAEVHHLTRAAERLHVSQSTASAHIRAIEESLDIQLFARSNRSMELTRAGELLLQRAKALLNDAAEFTSFTRELRGKLEGDLMVGASGDPAGNKIGEIVSSLHANHPLITTDVRALTSLGVRQALKTGELDVGVMLSHPNDPEFAYFQLATVAMRIAGPAAWKERIESATWTDLARLPWITPNEVSLAGSTIFSRLFKEKGLEVNSIVRFDRASVGRQIALAGVGMILMREDEALECEKEGSLALSSLARPELPLVLAHVASRADSPLIRAFLDATKVVWPEAQAL